MPRAVALAALAAHLPLKRASSALGHCAGARRVTECESPCPLPCRGADGPPILHCRARRARLNLACPALLRARSQQWLPCCRSAVTASPRGSAIARPATNGHGAVALAVALVLAVALALALALALARVLAATY